jgi:hypothetical protein
MRTLAVALLLASVLIVVLAPSTTAAPSAVEGTILKGAIKFKPGKMLNFKLVYTAEGIEGFDPAVDSFRLVIGSTNGDYGPNVAAGSDVWRGKNGKYSAKFDGIKIKVDTTKGIVKYSMKSGPGGQFVNPIKVEVDYGAVESDQQTDWTEHPKKPGNFKYP